MKNRDIGLQEQALFMRSAVKSMNKYHSEHGFYPKEWYLLDITFVNGPYRIDDPGISPSKDMGNKWRPKNCDFTYEITIAEIGHFLISAINQQDKVEYEINEKMDRPVKVIKD